MKLDEKFHITKNGVVKRNPIRIKGFSPRKYEGTWYEQGSTPLWFSKGCRETRATYYIRPDGTIDVLNVCAKDGKLESATGRAFPTDEESGLKVGFYPSSYPIFRAPYDVEYIEEENGIYTSAIVTSDDSVWVLTRRKKINDDEFYRLMKKAENLGIDTSKIERTIQ